MRFWLWNAARIEADLGKLAARLTRRALGISTRFVSTGLQVKGLILMQMSDDNLIGNRIGHHEQIGYFMDIFDYRPDTLAFMKRKHLQGGGPTWMALITSALELESPLTLDAINFDDESDVVRVTAQDESHLKIVQTFVRRLMSERDFMEKCINQASSGGYLE